MESTLGSNNSFSILIVEDDKSATEVLRLMIPLKFPDSKIYVAENGKAGVELSEKYAPDIVITDINMPGMDGLQMAEQIKTRRMITKFIVITGYSDKIHLDKFSRIGISEYILKPIDLQRLFTAIEKCIADI
jgi:two-component system response regulator YesN